MKILKASAAAVVAASGLALLATNPAFGRVRSLHQVETIRVEGDLCPTRITHKLNERGFFASREGSADAVLKVDVSTDGHLSDQSSMEEGIYRARLVGARGEVLFRTSGEEENINLGYLCDEIGEEIADDLEASMG